MMTNSVHERTISDIAQLLGYESGFKEKQEEAIKSILSENNTFVSLPTGYGKSLIYAALPLIFDQVLSRRGSIVVCVGPLISLMMDQRNKFTQLGISAEFVGEAQTDEAVVLRILHGAVQLVYISPESIMCNPKYRRMLSSEKYKENLVAFVVDEAHCAKAW